MWNDNTSCHINKQEMSQPSVTSGLQMWMRAPKLRSSGCCHPQRWLLRSWGNAVICHSLRWLRKQDWPQIDSWGAYGRNKLSESRGLHLPIHRMPNSLTWYLIFDAQPACCPCCKLEYSPTSPSCLLEAVFSELLRHMNNSLLPCERNAIVR